MYIQEYDNYEKGIRWDSLKNDRLKRTRGVSFDEIIQADLVAVQEHDKLGHQKVLLFYHRRYIWVVPFVEDQDSIFLKTLYPSRKLTKLYKEGKFI